MCELAAILPKLKVIRDPFFYKDAYVLSPVAKKYWDTPRKAILLARHTPDFKSLDTLTEYLASKLGHNLTKRQLAVISAWHPNLVYIGVIRRGRIVG